MSKENAVLERARYKPIDVSASGDTTIVAGRPGERIVLLGVLLIVSADVVVKFKDTGGYDLTGAMSFLQGTGMAPSSLLGFGRTAVDEGLVINLGGAVQVGGSVIYYRETV